MKQIFCLTAFIFISLALHAQSLSNTIMLPWVSTQDYMLLTISEIKNTSGIDALHAELWPSTLQAPFLFTSVHSTVSDFQFSSYFFNIPQIISDPEIPSCTISAVTAGMKFSHVPMQPAFTLSQLFIPNIQTDIEGQQFSLYSEPMWGICGSITRNDITMFSFIGMGEGTLHIQSVPLGSYHYDILTGGLTFFNVTLFYAFLTGKVNMSAQAMFTENIGVSIQADSSLFAHFGGIIGKFAYKHINFECTVPYFAGIGVAQRDNNYFLFHETINTNTEQSTFLQIDWNPSYVLGIYPSIKRNFSRYWSIEFKRLLLYQQNWNLMSNSAYSHSTSSTRIDPYIVLLAGCALSITYRK